MRIISPVEWGARVNYDLWDDPFTPDDGVALHHGGGSDYAAHQTPYSQDKEMALLRTWEWYHLSKGWRGLAYGFAVGQTGTVYRIRGFNRYGAHTGDRDGDGIANNDEIIPVLFIGSGNHASLSPAAQRALEELRQYLETVSPNARTLYGHKELRGTITECPGPLLMEYVETHRQLEKGEDVPELIDDRFKPSFVWAIENDIYSGARLDQLDTIKEPMVLQRMIVYLHRFATKILPGVDGADQLARELATDALSKLSKVKSVL